MWWTRSNDGPRFLVWLHFSIWFFLAATSVGCSFIFLCLTAVFVFEALILLPCTGCRVIHCKCKDGCEILCACRTSGRRCGEICHTNRICSNMRPIFVQTDQTMTPEDIEKYFGMTPNYELLNYFGFREKNNWLDWKKIKWFPEDFNKEPSDLFRIIHTTPEGPGIWCRAVRESRPVLPNSDWFCGDHSRRIVDFF